MLGYMWKMLGYTWEMLEYMWEVLKYTWEVVGCTWQMLGADVSSDELYVVFLYLLLTVKFNPREGRLCLWFGINLKRVLVAASSDVTDALVPGPLTNQTIK